MFDIGFAELIVIAIVGLLVIGPERLPGAIRTGAVWLGKLRRGFNEIKMEVQQELHNDSVMQDLRKTGEQIKENTESLSDDLHKTIAPLTQLNERGDEPPAKTEQQAGQETEAEEPLSASTGKE
ncbi:MAG: Sec-independent protein translocase protein TatB [Halioglobus sp.]